MAVKDWLSHNYLAFCFCLGIVGVCFLCVCLMFLMFFFRGWEGIPEAFYQLRPEKAGHPSDNS